MAFRCRAGPIFVCLGALRARFCRVPGGSREDFEAPGPHFSTFFHACAPAWSKCSECNKTTVLMGRNTLRKPCAQRNKSCKIVLAPFRKRLPMTIVANMRLGTCRARFRRGLGASQACLGRILAALGPLLSSFWPLLGVSGAPCPSFLNALGRIWALMGASGLDFGGSLVSPGWVLESSSGSFRHGFWPCLRRVAADSP